MNSADLYVRPVFAFNLQRADALLACSPAFQNAYAQCRNGIGESFIDGVNPDRVLLLDNPGNATGTLIALAGLAIGHLVHGPPHSGQHGPVSPHRCSSKNSTAAISSVQARGNSATIADLAVRYFSLFLCHDCSIAYFDICVKSKDNRGNETRPRMGLRSPIPRIGPSSTSGTPRLQW